MFRLKKWAHRSWLTRPHSGMAQNGLPQFGPEDLMVEASPISQAQDVGFQDVGAAHFAAKGHIPSSAGWDSLSLGCPQT